MELLALCYPTLAISVIYCVWQGYLRHRIQRERTLRDRVAWLLWTVADQTT
jgi:hypothetical protein